MENSIIVLSWNGLKYISECLSSISLQIDDNSEIILVDNGSSDGTPSFVQSKFPSVQVITKGSNTGVANGWNTGISHSKGKLIYFINQDVYLKDGWLKEIRNKILSSEHIGVVGGKLLYPGEQIIQHAGGQIHFPQFLTTHKGLGELDGELYNHEAEVDYVTGAAMCIKSESFMKIGTFDPVFFPAYYEDLDFCLRVKFSGLQVWYTPQAVAIHYHSSSLGKESYSKYYYKHFNRLRLVYKHLAKEEIPSFFSSERKWLSSSTFLQNEVAALSNVYLKFFYDRREYGNKWLQKIALIGLASYRAAKLNYGMI